ncbi:hypothetical protein DBR32_07720, partial [Taibaiella sp. KBW10]|uniref:gliding motility-associated C-terminal domain-containing protein n=1 Tax=Taibaiella sp. KBW10 TaxID=2153357 RepID=UPI000FB677B9
TGTWSPALNNTATTTYTFTPTVGQCANTATMTITVNPSITPTFTQVAAICSGATLAALPTTSNNSITGTWSPALNNTATTTYTFTPTAGQCANTTTMTITVNPSITPTFTQVAAICPGASFTALPATSTNNITGTWSPALNNTTTTTYTFTPTAGQCAVNATMTLTVNSYLSGLRTVTICAGSSYTFNGITYTTSNNTAKDTLANANSCDSILTLNLTVLPLNAHTQTVTESGCGVVVHNGTTYNNSTVLRDTLYSQYGCDSIYRVTNIAVYPQNGLAVSKDTFGCNKLVYGGKTYLRDTVLIDTLRSTIGCDSIYNTVRIHIQKIYLNLSLNPEMPYEGEYFMIHTENTESDPYTIVSWSSASLFADQTLKSQQLALQQNTTVSVIGITAAGCRDTATLPIVVRPYRKDVMIPNAFSPNGDGRNDVFKPVLAIDRAYNLTDFKIFNRWGQVVYTTSNINAGWDGTSFNGSLQPQDVYYYTLMIIFMDGTKQVFKGDVTLIR